MNKSYYSYKLSLYYLIFSFLRLLEGRISEEMIEIFPANRVPFPDNMAPDTYQYGYQIDIDQRQLNEAMNEGDENAAINPEDEF